MKLTQTAVDRPVATIMAVLIVVLISAVALSRLPIDLMPDITFPSLSIAVNYEGATPEEVETLVVRPIEEAMGSVENVERMDASCGEGSGLVQLRFLWGTNLDEVADDVRQRLDRTRGRLPDDVDPPVLYKWDMSQSPIMYLGVSSGTIGIQDLRHLAEHDLKNRLERVKGVAAVDVQGGLRREIQVNLSQEQLEALKISPQFIVRAIQAENVNLPAGEVNEGELKILMRTRGQFGRPEELADIVLTTREGVPIHLRDVAEVVDSFEEVRQVERINRVPGITLSIRKQSGSNTVKVAVAVGKEIENIGEAYPDIRMVTLWDSSTFIKDAIANVQLAAIFGAVLAVVILLIFLRNLRSTLIIATAIPISVMATFALIYFGGFTLNIMTFGGLALGVGLLVDNSIVVLENIFRHRESGESSRTSALQGTGEVATAITASTLTTLVVFLPVVFLSGAVSVMFSELAYVVVFGLTCSLLVALTLIPMLTTRLMKLDSAAGRFRLPLLEKAYKRSEKFFNRVDEIYLKTLEFSLRHRGWVIVGALTLFAAAIPAFRIVGSEFMPTTDQGEVRVYGEMTPGIRLEALDEAFARVEDIIESEFGAEVEDMHTSFGLSSWWRGGVTNRGSIRLKLTDPENRQHSSEEIAVLLRKSLANIPGFQVRTRATGGLWIFRRLQSQGERISVEIYGHELETGYKIAEVVQEKLEEIEGISDARLARAAGRPEVSLRIDRRKAAEVGLTVSEIAQVIRTNFGGEIASLYREAGDEYNIRVRLREEDRQRLNDLRFLWIVAPSGERVPVSNFVRQGRTIGPTQIERENQQRQIRVAANLGPNYTLGSVMKHVQAKMNEIQLPEGFFFEYGGEYEDQQKANRELIMGLILAIALVYMVMAAQFESLLHPLIIMFAIPFAAIGVLIILYLTSTTINVQSLLGVIMLAGIVVNNAIVLVDYINMLQRTHKMPLIEAVTIGGRRRLRPILMTTLTTALALLPMALGIGTGSEVQAPMARVVIGGLLTSMLITLVFVPTLYTVVEEWRQSRSTRTGVSLSEKAA